jgi:hypothetical protein
MDAGKGAILHPMEIAPGLRENLLRAPAQDERQELSGNSPGFYIFSRKIFRFFPDEKILIFYSRIFSRRRWTSSIVQTMSGQCRKIHFFSGNFLKNFSGFSGITGQNISCISFQIIQLWKSRFSISPDLSRYQATMPDAHCRNLRLKLQF